MLSEASQVHIAECRMLSESGELGTASASFPRAAAGALGGLPAAWTQEGQTRVCQTREDPSSAQGPGFQNIDL